MGILKQVVTVLMLVLLVGVSLAATIEVVRQGLPETANLEQGDWVQTLTSHDVRSQPREAHLRLVRRIEADLDQGFDWEPRLRELNPPRRDLLERNFAFLSGVWFRDQVATWKQLPLSRRDRFVQRRTNDMLRWRMPDVAGPKADVKATDEKPTMGEAGKRRGRGRRINANFFTQFQRTLGEMGREERQDAQQFLAAVQQRLMERALRPLQP